METTVAEMRRLVPELRRTGLFRRTYQPAEQDRVAEELQPSPSPPRRLAHARSGRMALVGGWLAVYTTIGQAQHAQVIQIIREGEEQWKKIQFAA
jgi:hypothetical protein